MPKNTLRPKIEHITLKAKMPDGTHKTYEIDLAKKPIIALFWDDKAIHEILAPFYEGKGYHINGKHIKERFPHVAHLATEGEMPLTPELIGRIWNTPNEKNGLGVAFLAKDPDCTIHNDI